MSTVSFYTGSPGHYIEYNDYVFPPKGLKVVIQESPVEDPSHRSSMGKKFLVRVTGYITSQNPSTTTLNKFFLTDSPLSNTVPNTDTEMELVKCRLQEVGKTLRIVGQGFNNIYVNTVDPVSRIYNPDLEYGPHPNISQFKPLGFDQAWYIDWSCYAVINNCCDGDINMNIPKNRLRSLTYEIENTVNERGYDNRSIRGMLIINSPVYHKVDDNGNPVRFHLGDGVPDYGWRVHSAVRGIVSDHKTPSPPAGAFIRKTAPIEHAINGPPGFVTDDGRYVVAEGSTYSPELPFVEQELGPTQGVVTDNVRNKYLYETVDQWKEYVEALFPIPLGYVRQSRQWTISNDRTKLGFSFSDAEKPPFSIVPKYAKVSGKHHTNTSQDNQFRFRKFESTISMSFLFPKFVYSPLLIPTGQESRFPDNRYLRRVNNRSALQQNLAGQLVLLRIYQDKLSQPNLTIAQINFFRGYVEQTNRTIENLRNQISTLPPDQTLPPDFSGMTEKFKRIPGKLEAFTDFMRVVYQRFAFALLTSRTNNNSAAGQGRGVEAIRGAARVLMPLAGVLGL